jgi:acetylornithine/succinyldiaminopimelate/putrescine aminotransferase/predicted amino acid dehydrogenase/acyl carrier protein
MSRAGRSPHAQDIERWLIEHLVASLGIEATALGHDTRLVDLGIDSAEAALLAGELEEWLQTRLSPTLVWEHPTLGQLAAHLARQTGGETGALRAGSGAAPARSSAAGVERPPRHPFIEHVNPHLGELLEQLRLDKCFARGRGCELFDATGRRYLDFIASYGAVPFGHNPPEIWEALGRVRDAEEPNLVQPSCLLAAGTLARRLVALAPPGLRYVTFTNSGAEAVEAAIKLCRAATGRPGILAAQGSFHGKTLGALSATGNSKYQEHFGAPAPGFEHVPFGDADALTAALAARPGHYAAFVVEPIQGEGGIVEPPPGYLARARALCQAAGALFVLDEVQTGLGRTGTMFACQAEGVVPDVMTLAKALGGGLVPIGACLASEAAYSETFALKHSSTFAGGGLACRVGLAALDLLERDGGALVRAVAENGARFKAGLVALGQRYPRVVAEVRGRGYMLGLRLGVDRHTWPSSLLGVAAEQGGLAPLLASYLLNVEGVRLAPTLNGIDVLRIEPPLTATWAECQVVLGALERTLAVLETGDAGRLLGGILTGQRPAVPSRVGSVRGADGWGEARAAVLREWEREGPPLNDGRFAFLLHPLDLSSYRDFDPTMGSLDAAALEEAARCLHGLGKPAVVSAARVVGIDGRAACGEFIVVPRTAEELMEMPRAAAVQEVREALRVARNGGARIVGLGAFTSVVTQGGAALAEDGLPLTSGNSATVAAVRQALRLVLARRRRWLGESTVAVVGAAGSIGRALAIFLCEDAARLLLVGNPLRTPEHGRRQLLTVAGEACRHVVLQASRARHLQRQGPLAQKILAAHDRPAPGAPLAAFAMLAERLERRTGLLLCTQDVAAALAVADVVVVATNSAGATRLVLGADAFKPGAIVCDVSRPRNVGPEVAAARPDLLVMEGGVMALPGRPHLGCFGLETGLAYACMAETMLLALEQRYVHTSVGPRLDLEEVLLLEALAERHGFTAVAPQDRALRTPEPVMSASD